MYKQKLIFTVEIFVWKIRGLSKDIEILFSSRPHFWKITSGISSFGPLKSKNYSEISGTWKIHFKERNKPITKEM